MSCKRYSNFDPSDPVQTSVLATETGSGLIYTGNGSSGSGWTSQNTVDVVNTGASALTTILTSIFGRNNQYLANSYSTMYNQEKRTNTILWVIIGLVLALGVVLVIRKTK